MAKWVWIIAALLFTFAGLKYNRRWSWVKLKLPPGPVGLPVLGNLAIFTASSSKLPHHVLSDLAKQYGPLMFLRLGFTPCVVLSSPEVCKELFRNQDHIFASRPRTSAVSNLLYDGRNIAFSPYGEYWRFARKIATLELLTHKKIHEFSRFREEVASGVVKAMYQDAVQAAPTNMKTMLTALTFNFMTQICFGKYLLAWNSAPAATAPEELKEIDAEEAKEFTELIEEAFTLLGVQLIGDYIPYLSLLDRFTNFKGRMIKAHKRLDEFLTRLLEEHRKHSQQQDPSPDYVGHLLGLQARDGCDRLDDTTIKSLCLEMILAGTDTSGNTLQWAMAEVVRHPDVAAKLQAELDCVVGKERLVTEADLSSLPYLQALVKETLRLHPAGALNVPHLSLQQTKLMGYDIPAHTIVFVNVWAMGRDPTVWDNPLQFRPDRFLERPNIDVKGQNYELLPFGAGRRGCPGMALGLTMVQYGMARLLQAFHWSPPKGLKPEDVDREEVWGLTIPRAHALEAVPTIRLPHHLY